MNQRCEICRFWSGGTTPANRCRRYPPVFVEAYERGQWPQTKQDDWCGAFGWIGKARVEPSLPEQRAMGVTP
jgi:hypothetical protein